MASRSFHEVFRTATKHHPYTYQERLATCESIPELLHVPTAGGKTAAAVLAWVWRRRFAGPEVATGTPRRLVYCLPMRVLVEQTRRCIDEWVHQLAQAYPDLAENPIGVHTLMGGDANDDWLLEPGSDCIIIGTQDMLLSRALNRAYAMSRFRWPVAFGLLNSDVLWVFDEVQLMGVGLATSLQMQAFREQLGSFGPALSVWMSATAREDWLSTVDHPAPAAGRVLRLSQSDTMANPGLHKRMNASKTVRQLGPSPSRSSALPPRQIASEAIASHAPGTLTLIIMNTVERATQVHSELRKTLEAAPRGRQRRNVPERTPDLVLLHSRFRPVERRQALDGALGELSDNGRIVVSTQVIEAGVDMDARILITELAPWSSVVQRLGRCNRKGEHSDAEVKWIDVMGAASAPYDAAELEVSRERLKALEGTDVCPSSLHPADSLTRPCHVIRRRDIIGLFDTTPDISGSYVDPGRFIRDANDLDVQVFWREVPIGESPPDDAPSPVPAELCAVPVYSVRDFLREPGHRAWIWDHLTESWARLLPARATPGQMVMVSSDSGGYSADCGWAPKSADPVAALSIGRATPSEGAGSDHGSSRPWQTIAQHTDMTVLEVRGIVHALHGLLKDWIVDSLIAAARAHDWGKAHPVFRETLLNSGRQAKSEPPLLPGSSESGLLWAKAPGTARHSRKHFRHELAGALALIKLPHLASAVSPKANPDLVAYLVASHHGRVRLAIRSLPGDWIPRRSVRSALGVQDGDKLPECDVGGRIVLPEVVIDMTPMEMGISTSGDASWASRMMALRDCTDLGPFRLAYLEALLRAADARASERSAPAYTGGDRH